MTKNEAKEIILKELNKVRERNFGVSADRKYQLGKVSGMIAALRIANVIPDWVANEIHNEILEEEF